MEESEASGKTLHYLPIIESLLRKVRAIEENQELVRNKMEDLKRSIFIQIAKELQETEVDRYAEIRLELFWKFVSLVLKKTAVAVVDIAPYKAVLDIMDCHSESACLEWFHNWRSRDRVHFVQGFRRGQCNFLWACGCKKASVPDTGQNAKP